MPFQKANLVNFPNGSPEAELLSFIPRIIVGELLRVDPITEGALHLDPVMNTRSFLRSPDTL